MWPDLCAFIFLMLVGHILLGHFEEHKPKWRRVLKAALGVVVFAVSFHYLGRVWTWAWLIGFLVFGVLAIHCWWLPRNGVNGWTGEPRERYLELVRRKR